MRSFIGSVLLLLLAGALSGCVTASDYELVWIGQERRAEDPEDPLEAGEGWVFGSVVVERLDTEGNPREETCAGAWSGQNEMIVVEMMELPGDPAEHAGFMDLMRARTSSRSGAMLGEMGGARGSRLVQFRSSCISKVHYLRRLPGGFLALHRVTNFRGRSLGKQTWSPISLTFQVLPGELTYLGELRVRMQDEKHTPTVSETIASTVTGLGPAHESIDVDVIDSRAEDEQAIRSRYPELALPAGTALIQPR